MTTIKDFIIKFNLKNIELFEFNIDEVLSLKHNFLLASLGVLPGESAYEILEAKVFLTLYFKDLTNQPKNILPVKKEIILIPSLLTCIDDKFIFNFTSVSTGLNISKKELNKFLKESSILISGRPSDNFPKEYYQQKGHSIVLNYIGYDWIVNNYIYNNSESSEL